MWCCSRCPYLLLPPVCFFTACHCNLATTVSFLLMTDMKVTKTTILGTLGVTFFTSGLLCDHGLIGFVYSVLALDKAVDDPDERPGPWFAEGGPFDYEKLYHGAKQRLLDLDKQSGGTHYRDAMEQCKDFYESNSKEAFDSSERRPPIGTFTVPAFSLPGGGVLLFSPHYISSEMKAELDGMGGVRAAFLPCAFHNMFTAQVKTLWPKCVLIGPASCAGLAASAFAAASTPSEQQVFFDVEVEASMQDPKLRELLDAGGFQPIPIDGLAGQAGNGAGEFALLHRPSGVLATSDLLYTLTPGGRLNFSAPRCAPEWDWMSELMSALHSQPVMVGIPERAMPSTYRVTMLAKARAEPGDEDRNEKVGGEVAKERSLAVGEAISTLLNRIRKLEADGSMQYVHGCHVPGIVKAADGVRLIEEHWGWAAGSANEAKAIWERVKKAVCSS
ncbi:unnamed protein product [Choristocarpus tenellus]